MESLGKLTEFRKKPTVKSRYLHSANHLLADELASKLHDKKHFGFYLKSAISYDHGILRSILGNILESKDVKTPGKLFAYLLKKHNTSNADRKTAQ